MVLIVRFFDKLLYSVHAYPIYDIIFKHIFLFTQQSRFLYNHSYITLVIYLKKVTFYLLYLQNITARIITFFDLKDFKFFYRKFFFSVSDLFFIRTFLTITIIIIISIHNKVVI